MPSPTELARQEEEALEAEKQVVHIKEVSDATVTACGADASIPLFWKSRRRYSGGYKLHSGYHYCPACVKAVEAAKSPSYEDLESALRGATLINAFQGRARLEAEASRDTVRAHAQACLDKYRRQDGLLDALEACLANRRGKTPGRLLFEVSDILRGRRGV